MKGGKSTLLAVLLCVALTACSTIPEGMGNEETDGSSPLSQAEQAKVEPAFGYLKGDVFNPYTAKTAVNRSFAPLLYESLYTLDETLEPQPQLAETAPWSSGEEETELPSAEIEITLREGAKFSNGKAVTAKDVEASFRLAKASARYRSCLQSVVSLKADGAHTVKIKLSSPDIRYAARFTFPIVSEATAQEEIPIGSGAYYVDKAGEALIANPHAVNAPQLRRAVLKPYETGDALRHALGTGQILLYQNDLATGEIPRVTAASAPFATSNLVFVGFNSQTVALTPEVRTAINHATDRTDLIQAAFAGYADVARSPFHPLWSGVSKSLFRSESNVEEAMSLLEEAGYRTAEGTKNRKKLKLTLLVSNGSQFCLATAQYLKESLLAVGVTVAVEEKPYQEYLAQLQSGVYDMYIGEIRLSDDLDLSPLLSGDAAYGVAGESGAAYAAYRNGTGSVKEFLATFEQELPFLPLCYRKGLLAYHRQLEDVRFTGFNLFSHIQDWKIRE